MRYNESVNNYVLWETIIMFRNGAMYEKRAEYETSPWLGKMIPFKIVEGVYSAKAAIGLAQKYGVQLPIIEQVNAVLFDGKDVRLAVEDLMLRDKKIEISSDWK